MKVLLDTCVLSELQRKKPDPRVQQALEDLAEDDLFLSVVSIGELAKGIALLRGGKKKSRLEDWLHSIETNDTAKILSIDTETARIWGELTARAQRKGRTVPAADGLIAATAKQHGLAVMTRNTSDFGGTGVELLNPWED